MKNSFKVIAGIIFIALFVYGISLFPKGTDLVKFEREQETVKILKGIEKDQSFWIGDTLFESPEAFVLHRGHKLGVVKVDTIK